MSEWMGHEIWVEHEAPSGYSAYRSAMGRLARASGDRHISLSDWRECWLKSPVEIDDSKGGNVEVLAPL